MVILRPSYAMYRFYAEVAGASIREIDYPPPDLEFPLEELLDAITPETRAVLHRQSQQPHRHRRLGLLAIERILAQRVARPRC